MNHKIKLLIYLFNAAILELLVKMEYESELDGEWTLTDGTVVRERRCC